MGRSTGQFAAILEAALAHVPEAVPPTGTVLRFDTPGS